MYYYSLVAQTGLGAFPRGPWSHIRHTLVGTLPRYTLLDLPHDVIRSVARFRLCAHTLRIETATWTHNTSYL